MHPFSDDARDPALLLAFVDGGWVCQTANRAWQALDRADPVGEPIGELVTDRFVAQALIRLCDLASTTGTPRRVLTDALGGRARLATAVPTPRISATGRRFVVLLLRDATTAETRPRSAADALSRGDLELVLVFGHDLRVAEANDAVCLVAGASRADILGRTNREMGYPRVVCEIWDAHTRRTLETGETHVLTYLLPTVLGPRPYESRITPDRAGDGTVLAARVVSRDTSRDQLAGVVGAGHTAADPLVEASSMWERFEPTAAAAARARRTVAGWLGSRGLTRFLDDTALAVSELATNAALHTGTDFYVHATARPGHVRVEVYDGSSALPVQRRPGSVGGRGLAVVAAVTRSWGVELSPAGGKVVWCELAETPEPTLTDLSADDLIAFWAE